MKRPEPDQREVAAAVQRSRDIAAVQQASPTRADLEQRFGPAEVAADGKWNVPITREHWPVEVNRRRMREFSDMMSKRRAIQNEQSQERDANLPKVKMRTAQGKLEEVPLVAAVAHENKMKDAERARRRSRGRGKFYTFIGGRPA